MKGKTLQIFSEESLENSRHMDPHSIIVYLENFRQLHLGKRPSQSKLISLKVPEDLLATFRKKADLLGIPYQTQIKKLMRAWTNK